MNTWDFELKDRLKTYVKTYSVSSEPTLPISIKIRVTSGCFHREHSPNAYEMIDNFRQGEGSKDYQFVEHENGPEILTYIGLGTATISFTAAVINLVSAILKARNEGIKKGDTPKDSIELIVRGFDINGNMTEEKILRISPSDKIASSDVSKILDDALNRFVK